MTDFLELTVELAELRKEYEAMQALVEDAHIEHNRVAAIARTLAEAIVTGQNELAQKIAKELHTGQIEGMFTDIRTTPNGVMVDAKHWATIVYGRGFGDLMMKPDGTQWNNVEQIFCYPDGRRIVVTVQRPDGLTPSEQRAAAIKERDAATKERDEAVAKHLEVWNYGVNAIKHWVKQFAAEEARADAAEATAGVKPEFHTCRCGTLSRRFKELPSKEFCPNCNREM